MSKKAKIVLVAAILVVALAFGIIFVLTRPEAMAGDKTITVAITHGDSTTKTVTIATDAAYLRDALEQEDLIAGEEGEYGLFLLTVDGETADQNLQQWWGYTKNGEYVETGVDTTVITDGDHFEFTLNTGW